jgi:hypothetical protein
MTNPRRETQWRAVDAERSVVADDITWSRGDGPDVPGPIEAMIMVMANRAVPMSEFHGDGVDLLATRVRPSAPATQP